MKPDLVLAWPENCDYPLYREFLEREQSRFNKVIVVFTKAPGSFNYSPWLFGELQRFLNNYYVGYSPIVEGAQDWRDVATKDALKQSESEWVIFSEQDFYINDGFWDFVNEEAVLGARVIGVYQDTRLHPCFIMMHKEVLNEIKVDFGIKSGIYDHFGMIQKQLEDKRIQIAKVPENLYRHYNGLSHNFRLVTEGEPPVYKPQEFIDYLRSCLKAEVPLSREFVRVAQYAIRAYDAENINK